MKRILIDGNGLFYNFPDLKLSMDEIHERIDKEFVAFDNYLFQNAKGSMKTMHILDLKPISGFKVYMGSSGWFLQAINKYRSLMKDKTWDKSFEDKIGEVIDFCFQKMDFKNKEDIKKFLYIYGIIASVTLALIFMYQNTHINIQSIKVPAHDKRFTFNYDHYAYGGQREITFLHGNYSPKRIAYNTTHLRLEYSGDALLVQKHWYENIFSYTIPPIFGKTIKQKNRVLGIIRGKTVEQIKQESQHETLKLDLEKDLSTLFPYYALKNESNTSDEIHIFGVSPKAHTNILEWINDKNRIVFYYFSDNDLNEINEIIKKFPKYKIESKKYNEIT